MTSRPSIADERFAWRCSRRAHITASFCRSTSLVTPLRASASSAEELLLGERDLLRGALHLDDIARAGHDEIGVGVGLRILGIVEIEHRRAVADAAGDRRHVIAQRIGAQHFARLHPGDAIVQRDPAAGDRGGAGAAVGLDHVAVDGDLPLAERRKIDDRAQAAADQALDLDACGRPACRRRPRGACARAWRAAACRIRR